MAVSADHWKDQADRAARALESLQADYDDALAELTTVRAQRDAAIHGAEEAEERARGAEAALATLDAAHQATQDTLYEIRAHLQTVTRAAEREATALDRERQTLDAREHDLRGLMGQYNEAMARIEQLTHPTVLVPAQERFGQPAHLGDDDGQDH